MENKDNSNDFDLYNNIKNTDSSEKDFIEDEFNPTTEESNDISTKDSSEENNEFFKTSYTNENFNVNTELSTQNSSTEDEEDDFLDESDSSDSVSDEETKINNNESIQQEEGNTEEYSYHNEDENNENIAYEKKISAEDADNEQSKPKVLNKKFLLTVLIVAFCIVFILSFIAPTKKNKDKNSQKPTPDQVELSDFRNFANPQSDDAYESGHYGMEEDNPNSPNYRRKSNNDGTEYDENGNVIIPPVISPEEQQKTKTEYVYTSTTPSANTVTIPDTRNDSLRGKQIAGIKGLTDTQNNYSTNYYETLNKNINSTTVNPGGIPTKEEYMNSVLSQYKDMYGNNNASAYEQQNNQNNKYSFYNNNRNSDTVGQGEWLDTNTIWQGTIFEAILLSDINTDLPGEIAARVTKNIYSSQDGRYLLIPQNSLLFGSYNSSISYSQSRVQVAWHTVIRPDGYKMDIGNMNGTDAKGASGLKGFVNDHPLAYLKAIALMSTVSIINGEFNNSMSNTDNEYVQNILANSQEVTMKLGDKLIDRAMNVQPTITIKAGTVFNIVVNQTVALPPMEEIPVTQKYMRNKKW